MLIISISGFLHLRTSTYPGNQMHLRLLVVVPLSFLNQSIRKLRGAYEKRREAQASVASWPRSPRPKFKNPCFYSFLNVPVFITCSFFLHWWFDVVRKSDWICFPFFFDSSMMSLIAWFRRFLLSCWLQRSQFPPSDSPISGSRSNFLPNWLSRMACC